MPEGYGAYPQAYSGFVAVAPAGNNRYPQQGYPAPGPPQSQQPYFSPGERPASIADNSPRVASAAPSTPSTGTASPATSFATPSKSRAIKIINPDTKTEVKVVREISTPSTAHASPVATPAPLPERVKTPLLSASPGPALGHNRTGSGTPVLSEDVRRERAEKAKAEVLKKIDLDNEAERKKKEEAERKKEEEEDRAKTEAEAAAKAELEAKEKEAEAARLKEEEERKLQDAEKAAAETAAAEAAAAEQAAATESAAAETATEAKDIESAEVIPATLVDAKDDETPLSTDTPVTPEDGNSPVISSALPKIDDKKKQGLVVDVKKPIDNSFAISIKNAKPIGDIKSIQYPAGVHAPSATGKFKYDFDFLLQFENVATGRPTEDWDTRIKNVQDVDENGKRPSASRSASGSGRGSARTPNMSSMPFGGMGQMGQLGSMGQLGTKMSSEQRFALSNARDSNPMGMNRAPSFGKMNSAQLSNMISSMSGRNGRQGNSSSGSMRGKRPERSNSGRDINSLDDFGSGAQTPEEKPEPLPVSANRWVPRKKKDVEEEKAPDGSIIYPPDVVQRKVNSLLNKMTLEKFDKISDQILEIVSQSKWERDGRTLRQVITLTFEKATDEAHWSNMYARFCKKVQESLGSDITEDGVVDNKGEPVRGGLLFRKYLLSKCQEQFEKGWKVQVDEKKTTEGATEVLTEEYYELATIKRRGLGLVRFVGELYMLDMISEKIMHKCIQGLLVADPSEEEVESLCGLMRTVGAKIDRDKAHKDHVDMYFARMKLIMEQANLPSRIKFMIMDIFDLRKRNWKIKNNADKGPKTIQEIHAEAQKEIALKELSKSRQPSMRFR